MVQRRRSRKRGGALRLAGGRRHRYRGRGFFDFIKKAGKWLKKNRIISQVGSVLGEAGVPYASRISKGAAAVGYGRRRRCHVKKYRRKCRRRKR